MKHEATELQTLLSDGDLGDIILAKVLENEEVVEDLIEEFCEQLEERIEANPMFHKRLTEAVLGNSQFRGRMMAEIVSGCCDE